VYEAEKTHHISPPIRVRLRLRVRVRVRVMVRVWVRVRVRKEISPQLQTMKCVRYAQSIRVSHRPQIQDGFPPIRVRVRVRVRIP